MKTINKIKLNWDWLHELQENQGKTMGEIANDYGVISQQIYYWMQQTEGLHPKTVKRICNLFGLNLNDIRIAESK